jgi:hypothetical protein
MNKYFRPKRVGDAMATAELCLGVSQGSPFKGTMVDKHEFWMERRARTP